MGHFVKLVGAVVYSPWSTCNRCVAGRECVGSVLARGMFAKLDLADAGHVDTKKERKQGKEGRPCNGADPPCRGHLSISKYDGCAHKAYHRADEYTEPSQCASGSYVESKPEYYEAKEAS